jgi:hypothetical protein
MIWLEIIRRKIKKEKRLQEAQLYMASKPM